MNCPKCSHPMHKAGLAWSGTNKVQRYRCNKCGTTTIKGYSAIKVETV